MNWRYFIIGGVFNVVLVLLYASLASSFSEVFWTNPVYMIVLGAVKVPTLVFSSLLYVILFTLLFKEEAVFVKRSKFILLALFLLSIGWFAIGIGHEISYSDMSGRSVLRTFLLPLLNVSCFTLLYFLRLKSIIIPRNKILFIVTLSMFLSLFAFPGLGEIS